MPTAAALTPRSVHRVSCRLLMRGSAAGFIVLLLAACGGPTSPTPAQDLPFQAGRYLLHLTGDTTQCNDLVLPQTGTNVVAQTALTLERDAWVARPMGAEGGSFEVRLRRTSSAQTIPSIPLAGAIQGVAIDSFAMPITLEVVLPPTGVRAMFSAPGTLSGSVAVTGFVAEGDVLSPVTFNKDARSVTCPAGAVRWFLSRTGVVTR